MNGIEFKVDFMDFARTEHTNVGSRVIEASAR